MNARRQAMATLAFAALAAGSALAAPLRAAHQSVLPARIGFLNFAPNNLHLTVEPFLEGMRDILGDVHTAIDEPVLKDAAIGTIVRFSHSSVSPTVITVYP